MKVHFAYEVDDDLRAAIGNRYGKKRATVAEVRRALEAAVEGWLEDVMYEWREGSARPREDDYEPDFDTGQPR